MAFVVIPVPMIARLMKTPNAYNELLAYGLYNSARKQKTQFKEALRQLVYCYYRERENLTLSLCSRLDKTDCLYDNGEETFNGDSFDPVFEVGELTEICIKDKDLEQEIWEWYDIYQFLILSHYKVNMAAIETIRILRGNFPSYDGEPWAKISPNLIDKYRERTKERDRVRFAMLLSLNSIVGESRFTATTKSQIVMRMFGAKNQSQLDENLKDESLKAMYDQYTTRKMYDGMRDELLKMQLIKCYYGYSGRAYVSTKYELKDIKNEVADFVIASKNKVTTHKENDLIFKEALKAKLTDVHKGTS